MNRLPFPPDDCSYYITIGVVHIYELRRTFPCYTVMTRRYYGVYKSKLESTERDQS
jgi:hypothetical protein